MQSLPKIKRKSYLICSLCTHIYTYDKFHDSGDTAHSKLIQLPWFDSYMVHCTNPSRSHWRYSLTFITRLLCKHERTDQSQNVRLRRPISPFILTLICVCSLYIVTYTSVCSLYIVTYTSVCSLYIVTYTSVCSLYIVTYTSVCSQSMVMTCSCIWLHHTTMLMDRYVLIMCVCNIHNETTNGLDCMRQWFGGQYNCNGPPPIYGRECRAYKRSSFTTLNWKCIFM